MAALDELERAYEKAKRDPKFQKRLDLLLKTYAGRPPALLRRATDEKTRRRKNLPKARRPAPHRSPQNQ